MAGEVSGSGEGFVDTKVEQEEVEGRRSGPEALVTVGRKISYEPRPTMTEPIESDRTKEISIGAATASEKFNEDRHVYDQKGMAVVCDGVGSSENGGAASEWAADFLSNKVGQMETNATRQDSEAALSDALLQADMFIQWEQHVTGQDMASTASVMKLIKEGKKTFAVIGNVGDSPVYRERNGTLKELTNYHRELPSRKHRPALGKSKSKPHVFSVRFKKGDRILLTTNGVRKNDPEMTGIKKLTDAIREPQELAQSLVSKLKGKSPDARTVIVVDRQ
jgi:serine/threonine protein phosphatase PrpC